MTPQELRKLTNKAIERAKQEREMKIKKEYEAELRADKQAALKAEGIIEQIPRRAETEAAAGRDFAIVMSLKYNEYETPSNGPAYISSATVGGKAALLVWRHCIQAGFKPELEAWDDGMGIKGGYNIVIHW